MKKTADITVIIPCRNYEHTLPTTLKTLNNQFLSPKRIIVVDDGGKNPDLCKNICESHGAEYYRNDNWDGENTPRQPLQIGIDVLKKNPTEFFIVCGADAYWLPNKLYQEYNEIIKSKQIGVVYSNFIVSEQNFTKQKVGIKKFTKDIFPDGKVYDIDPKWLLESCIVTDNSLTRFEALKNINFELRKGVHRNFMWDLWLNISDSYKIKFINTFGSMYWKHEDNISSKWNYKSEEFKNLRQVVVNSAKKRKGIK